MQFILQQPLLLVSNGINLYAPDTSALPFIGVVCPFVNAYMIAIIFFLPFLLFYYLSIPTQPSSNVELCYFWHAYGEGV